jgi:hypothetical protein
MEEGRRDERTCEHVVRGYFGLGDHEQVVYVTSDADFVLHTWARNVETFPGGVEFLTPPSQFRGSGSTGPADGLVLNVPPQTGMSLGAIGAQAGETIDISSHPLDQSQRDAAGQALDELAAAFGARVTVFLTVVTCHDATVSMTWDEV